MLDSIIAGTEITVPAFLIGLAVSILLGLGVALLCPSAFYQSDPAHETAES